MKRLLCAAVFVLAGTARADEPTAEQLAKDVIRSGNELVKVLDGVKDKAAAEKAKPKADDLRAKWEKAREGLWKKPEKEIQPAYEVAIAELGMPADVPAAWNRMAQRFPFTANDPVLVEEARGEVAVQRANVVLVGCEAYYINPQSGNQYPLSLRDLLAPPFGGVGFLKNGVEDLLDTWGVPFKYEVGIRRAKWVDGTERDSDWPYIWTERKIDGKVRVFGTKPPEKKK
jgi:hypothetical protein